MPFTYKFSRDVIFTDDQNHLLSTLELHICIVIALKNLENLIFVDDKLTAKTMKIMSLKNLYVYGIYLLI